MQPNFLFLKLTLGVGPGFFLGAPPLFGSHDSFWCKNKTAYFLKKLMDLDLFYMYVNDKYTVRKLDVNNWNTVSCSRESLTPFDCAFCNIRRTERNSVA